MEYTCRICGRQHEIYFGVRGGESTEIVRLNSEQPDSIVHLNEEGTYVIEDKQVILPAVLLIPTAYDTPLWFVTWVELDKPTYNYWNKETKGEAKPTIECKLFESLAPHYDNTRGLHCSISHLPEEDNKPLITILDNSPLKTDQQKGLSKPALLRIMDRLHHDKEYSGRVGNNLDDIYLGQLAGKIDVGK